jgi:hypothetical protein
MAFDLTYKARGNFLAWCEFWIKSGYRIHHTSWKPYYPKYKFVELSSKELVEKHSYNKYIHMNKEYHAIDEEGTHLFFDRTTMFKGEWQAKFNNDVGELFE